MLPFEQLRVQFMQVLLETFDLVLGNPDLFLLRQDDICQLLYVSTVFVSKPFNLISVFLVFVVQFFDAFLILLLVLDNLVLDLGDHFICALAQLVSFCFFLLLDLVDVLFEL